MTGGIPGPESASLNVPLEEGELEVTLSPQGNKTKVWATWPEALRTTVEKHLPTGWSVRTRQNRCETSAVLTTGLTEAVDKVRTIFGEVQALPPTGYWFYVPVPHNTGEEPGAAEALGVDVLDPEHHRTLSVGRFEPGPLNGPDDPHTRAFMEAVRTSPLCEGGKVEFISDMAEADEAKPHVTGEVTIELTEEAARDYLGAMTAVVRLYAQSRP
jgi:hypothetical protein